MKIKNMFETTTQKKMTFLTTKKRMQILPVRLAKMEIIRLREVTRVEIPTDVRSGASQGFYRPYHPWLPFSEHLRKTWMVDFNGNNIVRKYIPYIVWVYVSFFFCWCFFCLVLWVAFFVVQTNLRLNKVRVLDGFWVWETLSKPAQLSWLIHTSQ